jgi:hypothetical protein
MYPPLGEFDLLLALDEMLVLLLYEGEKKYVFL